MQSKGRCVIGKEHRAEYILLQTNPAKQILYTKCEFVYIPTLFPLMYVKLKTFFILLSARSFKKSIGMLYSLNSNTVYAALCYLKTVFTIFALKIIHG